MSTPRKPKSPASKQRDFMLRTWNAARAILTTTQSDNQIAAGLMSKTTVGKFRRVLQQQNIAWADVEDWHPEQMFALLKGPSAQREARTIQPDWNAVWDRKEQTGLSKYDLWLDYKAQHPEGMSYPRFAARLVKFEKTINPTMKQCFRAAERMEVDYAGSTLKVHDPHTGEATKKQIFVAAMGLSRLIYAEASDSQKSPDFLASCVRALEFVGGVPEQMVTDNLRSAVTKPGLRSKHTVGTHVVFQRDYAEFGRHYDLHLVNARPRTPRDKAIVEGSVRIITNVVIKRLREQRFHSLSELNAAILDLVRAINRRTMRRFGKSRQERFDTKESPYLRPLPASRYEYAQWVHIKAVPKNYHVTVQHHHYSVPYTLTGQSVQARITGGTLDIFHDGALVATHPLSTERGEDTTVVEHHPPQFREWGLRSVEGFTEWAKTVGPQMAKWVNAQFARTNPSMGLTACDDAKKLVAEHGSKLMELAAGRALMLRSPTVSTLQMLVANCQPVDHSAPTRLTTLGIEAAHPRQRVAHL